MGRERPTPDELLPPTLKAAAEALRARLGEVVRRIPEGVEPDSRDEEEAIHETVLRLTYWQRGARDQLSRYDARAADALERLEWNKLGRQSERDLVVTTFREAAIILDEIAKDPASAVKGPLKAPPPPAKSSRSRATAMDLEHVPALQILGALSLPQWAMLFTVLGAAFAAGYNVHAITRDLEFKALEAANAELRVEVERLKEQRAPPPAAAESPPAARP